MRLFLLRKALVLFAIGVGPLYGAASDFLMKKEREEFKNLFDKDLYQLEKVNAYDSEDESILDDESIEKKIDRLNRRKKKCLEEKILADIETFKSELRAFDIKKFGNTALKSLSAGGISTAGVSKLAKASLATAVKTGIVTGLATASLDIAADYFFDASVAADIKRADLLIGRLKRKLDNEPIKEIEIAYIKRKYDTENPLSDDKITAIEEALIEERLPAEEKRGIDYGLFISEILLFPKDVRIVPNSARTGSISEFKADRDDFLEALFPSLASDQEPSMSDVPVLDSCRYSEETRIKLKKIIQMISNASWKSHRNSPTPVMKRGFLFFGKPGTGKTKATGLIADACGLNLQELTIRQDADVEVSSLFGAKVSPYSIERDTKGSVVEAFLVPNKDGKRAKNFIIFLDDIDRGFGDQVQGLVNFLLELIDPEKRSHLAEYYGINLDFTHIFVIATMNKDIRNDPSYEALQSRFFFVDFGDLNEDSLRSTIVESIKDDDLELSTAFGDNTDQWDTIRAHIAGFLIQYTERDLRQLALNAQILIDYPEEEWDDVAKIYGWTK